MPMPLWWGHINKRVFNRRELKKGKRPVLTHVGRTSGTVFRTPLDAHQVGDGYIFILVYGSRSDWVKNVLAAGMATLKTPDGEFDLIAPRLIGTDEAWGLLPPTTQRPPGLLKISEYLQMDVANDSLS